MALSPRRRGAALAVQALIQLANAAAEARDGSAPKAAARLAGARRMLLRRAARTGSSRTVHVPAFAGSTRSVSAWLRADSASECMNIGLPYKALI